jgi:hypothetical protein
MSFHGLWFGEGWNGEWYGGDGGAPVEGGYFGHRYFGATYFGPRYFSPPADVVLPPEEAGGYFGHRYFPLGYFGYRYYSPAGDIDLSEPGLPPDTGITGGAPSFRWPLRGTLRREREEQEIMAIIIAALGTALK